MPFGPWRRSHLLAGPGSLRVAIAEYAVDLPPRRYEQLASACDLRIAPRAHDLREGECDVADQLAHLGCLVAHVRAHLLPRRGLLAALLQVSPTRIGELEQLAPVHLLGADQALVLELLKRGIDRAGARAPSSLAALLHLLHDLVAVARLLGDQQQRGGADVAAARLAPPADGAGAEPPEGKAADAAPRSSSEPPVAMAPARPAAPVTAAAHRAPEPAQRARIAAPPASSLGRMDSVCIHD